MLGLVTSSPVFASDPATARYYDRRAAEYDDWYEGTGCSPRVRGQAGTRKSRA